MRKKPNNIQPGKRNYSLIADGDCEKWYFQMLLRNNGHLRASVEPSIDRLTLDEQFELAKKDSLSYEKVFWVLDMDVPVAQTRVAKKGKENDLDKIEKYIAILKKLYHNVVVVLNNPCLEYWLLLHYRYTVKQFTNCDDAGADLKKVVPSYEKTKKYYLGNPNIYERFRPMLTTALANARRLPAFGFNNPSAPTSQMHLVFDALGIE